MVVPTVSNLQYPKRLKVANACARAAEVLRLPTCRLDVPSILQAARSRTGLDDWGDEAFLTPMSKMLSTAASAAFTPLGRRAFREASIVAVSNRLRREAWLKRRPWLGERPVRRPIFIVGFPRSGTTLLQNLLAQSPRRGLEFWELALPVPMHEEVGRDRALRRAETRKMLSLAYQVAPEMASIHSITEDTLEECWPLFMNSFSAINWELQTGLAAYGNWLMSEWDMRSSYRDYRRYLQIALDRAPADQLVLKCPEHLWFLDELLDVFPDACVVWTHRDPYDTVASYCSLMSLAWRTFYGSIDRPRIGEFIARRLQIGIDRAMSARARHPRARFFDLQFKDLVADPVGAVRRLAAHFGMSVGPIEEYLRCRRPDHRGQHHYDGRLYGLDRERVSDLFAKYISTFT